MEKDYFCAMLISDLTLNLNITYFFMKAQNVLTISIVALLCLFLLQGVWLYNTYQLKLDVIYGSVNSALGDAVSQELDFRVVNLKYQLFPADTSIVFDFTDHLEESLEYGVSSLSTEHFQSFLESACQSPLNVAILDSIFGDCMNKQKLSLAYQLHYRTTDSILVESGKHIAAGYISDPVQIMKNKYVEAIVKVPMPLIFQQMFTILIVSLVFLILLVVILIYETRFIFTQQRLNQLRDDFTRALTHNMKTPLNAIYFVLNQWEKGVFDNHLEMRSEYCKIANEQVLILQALYDRILTTAYIEKQKLNLNVQPVDLEKIINGLVDKFTIKDGKLLKFYTHFDLKDTQVNGDSLYLTNAISNLIDNAIKYSNESVVIHLSCIATDQMIQIKVKDNGWGIPIAYQSKIFNSYERGAAIKQQKVKGFGLGLSYVKGVVEAHGGTVVVSSMPNEGSEFVIALPVNVK